MPSSFRWIVAFAALSAACAGPEKSPPAAGSRTAPRSVTTAAASQSGTGTGVTPVSATVEARRRAALSARVPASVVELPFREGERVAEGAVVVRLDDTALRGAVQAAEAADRAAEAERVRMESLRSRDAATPRETDEAVARASAAHAALLAARDNLAYAALRAPFAGVVASRPAHVGDVAAPGATLIEIEGDGGHEVVAALDAAQARALRLGDAVAVVVDGMEGEQTARVTALSPAADPTTHRFEARARLDPAAALRSGLFARVLVPGSASEPRVLVPSSALFDRGGLTGLFVVDHGTARLRWVAPGAASGDRTEVRAGLAVGEHVVVDPGGLEDGAAVVERSNP
jgi:RND family efflux transporter MFP subunit